MWGQFVLKVQRRVLMPACVLLLRGLLLAESASAQRRPIDSYSLEDGLPQSQVMDVLQDERGYVWLALFAGGVARFDGHTFKTFTVADGLPANTARALHQILLNLLSNAVKFTEDGEVVLRVELASAPDPGQENGWHKLHFRVRDTGIGIPEEEREQLFDSFSQADASVTREYGGTGLGLSISKQLVEAMGGEIWVESEVGEGSTFHFTIEAEESPQAEGDALQPDRAFLSGKRVLVVEDNATTRQLLVQLAERADMTAAAAATKSVALDRIESGEWDAVLLDEDLPEMSGLALARLIQKRPTFADLPLLMLSTSRQGEEPEDLEIAAWLHKPVKESSLYGAFAEIFRGKSASAAVSEKEGGKAGAEPLDVLLAEDDAVNQKMTRRLLEEIGHRVEVVPDGKEALRVLRERTHDVVLMDVQMPEMDGLEATRRLREEWAAEEQPYVIALTAAVMKNDRERCREAGMDAFLSKPVQREKLAEALEARTSSEAPRIFPSLP